MYDLWGVTIGVLSHDGALLGMARLLPSSGKFMLENEFGALLPGDYSIRKERDTAEITRLTVDPDIQDAKRSTQVMLATLKGIYQWAVENEVRYYYLEVEHRFLRALRMLGFPCESIGPVVKLPRPGQVRLRRSMTWLASTMRIWKSGQASWNGSLRSGPQPARP
ncbi:MAG: hypothetical protein HC938_00350 [Nitrospira sp.]|nr:hypothetical protein [Nitrospira sp.]